MKTSTARAQKSFELSQEMFQHNDYNMSRIYCLNAISNSFQIDYVKYYLSILDHLPKEETRASLDQILNILQISLFQTDPENITEILKLMEKINEEILSYNENEAEIDNNVNNELPDSVSYLVSDGELSWSYIKSNGLLEDINTIQRRVQYLQDCLENENRSAEISQKLQEEMISSMEYLDFLNKKNLIKLCIKEIDKEIQEVSSPELIYIASRMMNVSTLLGQIYLLKLEKIFTEVEFRNILRDITSHVEEADNKFNKIKSEKLFKDLMNKAHPNFPELSKKTYIIETISKAINEINSKIQLLTYQPYIETIQKKIEVLNEQLVSASKARFALYQEKVANLCYQALQKYEGTTVVWEADAENFLNKFQIATIDESLLAPETNEIYHAAKSLLLEKLSANKKADFRLKCVLSYKMKLENF